MPRPRRALAVCGTAALMIANAAALAVEPSPLLLPYGAKPLTLERLKATFGSALRATSFGCAPGAVEADGRKCESWVVEKKVALLVEFDYVRYRMRAADNVVDPMELVKAGDCDKVIAAYAMKDDGASMEAPISVGMRVAIDENSQIRMPTEIEGGIGKGKGRRGR